MSEICGHSVTQVLEYPQQHRYTCTREPHDAEGWHAQRDAEGRMQAIWSPTGRGFVDVIREAHADLWTAEDLLTRAADHLDSYWQRVKTAGGDPTVPEPEEVRRLASALHAARERSPSLSGVPAGVVAR